MIPALDQQRVARAVLTYLAEPGDPVLAALLDVTEPASIVAAVAAGRLPGRAAARLTRWAPEHLATGGPEHLASGHPGAFLPRLPAPG